MTLQELKQLKDQFEEDGRQAKGVYLTPQQTQSIRWELHQLYGTDPGTHLPTLYGLEVLAMDAEKLRFEEYQPS